MESRCRSGSSGLMSPRSLKFGRPIRSNLIRQYNVWRIGRQRLCASPIPLRHARAKRRRQAPRIQGTGGRHGGIHCSKCRRRDGMCQSPAERGRFVGDTEIGLGTIRATCWLRNQQANRLLGCCVGVIFVVAFGIVGIGSFDLYKAFAAD